MKSPARRYAITNKDGSISSFDTQWDADKELARRKKHEKFVEFITRFQNQYDNVIKDEYWCTEAQMLDDFKDDLATFLMENKLP